jgi:hypothetical protein
MQLKRYIPCTLYSIITRLQLAHYCLVEYHEDCSLHNSLDTGAPLPAAGSPRVPTRGRGRGGGSGSGSGAGAVSGLRLGGAVLGQQQDQLRAAALLGVFRAAVWGTARACYHTRRSQQ